MVPALGCAMAYHSGVNIHCTAEPKVRRFSLVGGHAAFQTVDARQFMRDDCVDADPAPDHSSPMNGRIVLVGGNYGAARDQYVTPAGELPGVEVIANAAQSYLPKGKSVLEAPWWASALFDLFIGSGVIALYWGVRLTRAFWLNLTVAPVVAALVSFASFKLFDYWLAFVPVLLGMLIHELHDHAEHLHELEEGGEEKSEGLTISHRIRRLLRYPRRGHS